MWGVNTLVVVRSVVVVKLPSSRAMSVFRRCSLRVTVSFTMFLFIMRTLSFGRFTLFRSRAV